MFLIWFFTLTIPLWVSAGAAGADYDNNPEQICNVADFTHHFQVTPKTRTLRTPGLATTWALRTGTETQYPIEFVMWPFTSCQSVQICAGDLANLKCTPQQSLLYDTMQQTVLANGETLIYPFPKVVLRPENPSSNKFQFTYFADLNKGYQLRPLNKTVQLDDNITILTSSPSCNVYVNRLNGATLSYTIHSKTAHENDLDFKSMAGAGQVSKTYNNFILNATLTKAVPIASSLCEGIFADREVFSEGDDIMDDLGKSGHPTFIAYTMALKTSNPNCALTSFNSTGMKSFEIDVPYPRRCKWIRLCFSNGATGGVCTEPSLNLDILPLMNLYVPTDTDRAQNFGVPIDDLKRFHFFLFDIGSNNVVMRMNYGKGDANRMVVIEDMLLKVDFTKEVTINLGLAAGCSASFVEKQMGMFNTGPMQCLSITKCTQLAYP